MLRSSKCLMRDLVSLVASSWMRDPMRRREFISVAGGVLSWPIAGRAQQPTKASRIGYLGLGTAADIADRVEALRAGLRDLGYVEGKDIVFEFRLTESMERLREHASELVGSNV